MINKRTEERLEDIVQDMEDYYIYIKSIASFYWIERGKLFKPRDVSSNLMCHENDLKLLRKHGYLETYDDLCYSSDGEEGCYNLLNLNDILQPSNIPIIDENIETLIHNLCGNKEDNIHYLHKAILYKYSHIDDFTIPAIVFYGAGGSGKGTFISLLSTIFEENNTLANLGQRDISGGFDTYKGQKLIVSFDELASNNTRDDIRILNRLKNLIGAEKITINEKGEKQYQINNIAWFFISSNSNQPIQLDDKDKGNRRFTIIRSDNKLSTGESINITIRDKEKVSNYLAWLLKNYPETVTDKKLDALDNEDKRELEDRSQNEANNFWEWFEEKYPDQNEKIFKKHLGPDIEKYCFENSLIESEFKRYFWNYSKYPLKKIRIDDKTNWGVDLRKHGNNGNISEKCSTSSNVPQTIPFITK